MLVCLPRSLVLSYTFLYYKLLDKSIENTKATREANKFLKVGVENFDGNSIMLHLSFNRPSFTKLNPFAVLRMSPDEAKYAVLLDYGIAFDEALIYGHGE